MDTAPLHFREFEQIKSDGLYPAERPGPNDQDCDRRCQAIVMVLSRLPEVPYQRLKRLKCSKRRSFDWFVPRLEIQGLVFPFLPNVRPRNDAEPTERFGDSILLPYARIVYVSPILEFAGWDNLVYVVAHELAHVYLNHAMHSFDSEGRRAEREVYRRVISWGFAREANHIEGLRKAAESELISSSDVRLPDDARRFVPLARMAGIDIRAAYTEGDELCVEVFSSGDLELLCKAAACEFRTTIERYNDGDSTKPLPRFMLLVYVPLVEVPTISKTLAKLITIGNARYSPS